MKNSSKTDRRRHLKLSMRVVLALVVVGLLVVPVAVQADLKIIAVVRAWDNDRRPVAEQQHSHPLGGRRHLDPVYAPAHL